MRERINLDVDTYIYAAPCISDHCASALPGFLSSERAVLPRCVIGKFPRDFVRSFNDRSIDRYRSRGIVAAPQLVQEPWNSANSCGTVWRTLRTRFTHEGFFRHYAQILQGQWRRRRKASLTPNNSRFHREKIICATSFFLSNRRCR